MIAKFIKQKIAARFMRKAAEKMSLDPAYLENVSIIKQTKLQKTLNNIPGALEKMKDENAINLVGYCFFTGLGTRKSPEQAFAWCRKAAHLGNSKAQENLGMMYFKGIGTSKNFEKSFAAYSAAAEDGRAGAQAMLGHMYHHGIGVKQDYAQAFAWCRKAVEQGNAEGYKNLCLLRDGVILKDTASLTYDIIKLDTKRDLEILADEISAYLEQQTPNFINGEWPSQLKAA